LSDFYLLDPKGVTGKEVVMKKRVLVADNEGLIRKLIKMHLAKKGYYVAEAEDGQDALEQLIEDNFDLLICDILMANNTGIDVLKRLKSNPKTRDIPIIMLTTKKEVPDLFEEYQLGADYYLTKPFTKSQLLHGIELMFEATEPA
jgi:CheY-like chemotaxis protein